MPLLQVVVFQEKQGILQQINICPSNKPKKACIRPCDINNSTQSLTSIYHHTATEGLYRLCVAKVSWTSMLAEVPYQFGFVCSSICMQCKISESSVFSFFSHEVSHHKVRKVIDSSFWKKRSRWVSLGGLKKSLK